MNSVEREKTNYKHENVKLKHLFIDDKLSLSHAFFFLLALLKSTD